MLKNLFSSIRKYNATDLLNELLKDVFVESKVNDILKTGNIDINSRNSEGETFLHLCAQKNLVQSMQWLIANKADVNIQTTENLTPIFYSVMANKKEATQILINHGAIVDFQNKHKRTPLQEAVISGKTNVIDLLLKHSKDINHLDEHGHNIIFDAISNGSKELIKNLANYKGVDLNQIDKYGNSILHKLSVIKDNALAIELMEAGADPTINDIHGKNFLFYAAAQGIENENVIDSAIRLGCDINSTSKRNQSILMEVLLAFMQLTPQENNRRQSLLKMIKKLIQEDIDLSIADDNGETALFIPVRAEEIETMAILLEENTIDINHQNNDGYTVLDLAVFEGIKNLDIILILLNYNANPNIKDFEGKTIIEKLIDIILHFHNDKKINSNLLAYTKEDGQYMLVLKEIFQNSEVDMKLLNSCGKPILFDSILYKNDNLFKLLRQYGCNINHKDSEGRNIIYNLMEAAEDKKRFNHKSFLETLQSLTIMGADVNSRDSFGGTTVHKAILDKCEYTVKVLLDAKADLRAVDNKGRSYVHNCVWGGKVKHFKLLHSYDQNILNKPDKFGILPINYAAFMGQKDLVIEMIRAGSYVNNNNKKNPKMIEFLLQFAHNLDKLPLNIEVEYDRNNMQILISNMKKEFGLIIV